MRVLFYQDTFGLGGIEKLLADIAECAMHSDVSISWLCTRKDTSFFDEKLSRQGIQVDQIVEAPSANPVVRYFQGYSALVEHLRHASYDVVHIHANHGFDYVLALAAVRARSPFVLIHSHNGGMDRQATKQFGHHLAKVVFGTLPNGYVACSQKAAEWLFPKQVLAKKDYVVINNGISFNDYRYNERKRMDIRCALGIADKTILLHVGRFNEQKNHSFLLDLMPVILQRAPKAVLLLVGEGDLEASIRLKAKRMGIDDSVIMLGAREDISALLSAADAFVFPSLFEGLGIAALEAQAAGLSVVCSDRVPSAVDISGRVQFVSLDADKETWASAILSAANETQSSSRVLRIDTTCYGIEASAQELFDLYKKCVGNWRNA